MKKKRKRVENLVVFRQQNVHGRTWIIGRLSFYNSPNVGRGFVVEVDFGTQQISFFLAVFDFRIEVREKSGQALLSFYIVFFLDIGMKKIGCQGDRDAKAQLIGHFSNVYKDSVFNGLLAGIGENGVVHLCFRGCLEISLIIPLI